MRLPRTLSTYILKEAVQYTLLGLTAITVVFVSRSLLRFLDDLVAIGFDLSIAIAVMRCLVSMLVGYTLPVAFLFGVLLAIGRLASNSEVTAMRASGIGIGGIVAPLLVLGVLISCVTWWVAIDVDHTAQRELRVLIKKMAAHKTRIEPGSFRRFGQRVLYVRSLDGENGLQGVMISDRSDPEKPLLIFAESGHVDLDPQSGEVRFTLENGSIHVEPVDGDEEMYRRISFANFDYGFALEQFFELSADRVRPAEMSMAELRKVVEIARAGESLKRFRKKNPAEYELQIHRRVALPVAPILFALVGAPLALRGRRGARSWGAFLCALVAFGYYSVLTFSQYMVLEGYLPAAVALWLPNGVFAAAAFLLLRRASGFES